MIECPKCGAEMWAVDRKKEKDGRFSLLYICPCGASQRVEEKPAEIPKRCTIASCPERRYCDYIDTPTRCLTFRAIKVKRLSICKD